MGRCGPTLLRGARGPFPLAQPEERLHAADMRSRVLRSTLVLITGAVFLVACGGGDNQAKKPNKPTTTTAAPTTTTGPAPTTVVGSTTGTTLPATTTPTSPGCATVGGTTEVRVNYPNLMSSLVGKDVRTGTHPCMERFVIELQPTDQANPNFPGYWVRYATGPIALSPSDQPVTIRGGAVLLVSMGSPMQRTDGKGYAGSRDVVPTNIRVIREYRLIEDFEGQSTWAIGLDTVRNFKVSVFDGPPRLVVDIQT
jgi:hypothetical protein